MPDILLEVTKPSKGYELLDSGDGEKLERYGNIIFRRPDPQALWAKSLDIQEWNKAHASFNREGKKGDWNLRKGMPEKWQIEFGNLKLWIRPTAFKHTGLFPEQLSNWDWMREKIRRKLEQAGSNPETHGNASVLNLFGYTGGASIAAAQAGASVVHVDGSKVAIQWGKDNAKASGLEDKPIRWILDDARTFVKREIKRGNKYDGILLDPPAFGHGPKKELWKIEDDLPELLKLCSEILSDKPLFFLINGYASGYSSLAYENNLKQLIGKFGGSFEKGELAIEESKSNRLLPCGIFARWSSI